MLSTLRSTIAIGVAPAEWALDFYGGAAWTLSSDQHVSGRDNNGTSVNATIFDVNTGTGFTAGGGPAIGLALRHTSA